MRGSPDSEVRSLVFDVESVADGELIARVRYPGEGLSPEQAIARYRAELIEEQGTDFIPYTYQIPAAVVVAKVASDFRLLDLVALDEPHFRPSVMTAKFWKGWEVYGKPTLVTFNGRTFDIPLLELAAFRYGLPLAAWFDSSSKSWSQPRNRYNVEAHFDLLELLTNMGASRFSGGLNLAATLLGRPGKMDVSGYMVQDMFNAGRFEDINDYCRCDVLDTYFVFLRALVLQGRIPLEREQELTRQTEAWIREQARVIPTFARYLEQCRTWQVPDELDRRNGEGVRAPELPLAT